MPLDPTDHPHRRVEDRGVTYKEMVEFVSDEMVQLHTTRAESLLLIGRELEKMEKDLREHEVWHRDVLQQTISNLSSNRIALLALVFSTLLGIVSVIVAILAIHSATSGHGA